MSAPTPSDVLAGTRLVIIRHGEAACNAEDYIGGHRSCRGLTGRGRAQAQALAARLARTGELAGAAVFTSILPRAVETGAILAEALGTAIPEARCGLCERHPGEADGLSWRAYEARYPRLAALEGVDEDAPFSPGGESWSSFVGRATATLEELAAAHPGRLVVAVAHGGVVTASLRSFLGLSGDVDGLQFDTENTAITEWLHTGTCWQLRRYNDAAHLQGLVAGPPVAPPSGVRRNGQQAPTPWREQPGGPPQHA